MLWEDEESKQGELMAVLLTWILVHLQLGVGAVIHTSLLGLAYSDPGVLGILLQLGLL